MHAEISGIQERVLRDWGLVLPDSVLRFWTFLSSLGPVERRALQDMDVAALGVTDLYLDPRAQPRDGVDIRVHGRYYRDPPEFLSFLHGGSDGLHYGLWFDDGRTCDGVASYYTNDGGGIDLVAGGTPLEAVRTILERCWRDLDDDDQQHEEVVRMRAGRALLREALAAYETGDRPETGIAYLRAHTHDYVYAPVVPGKLTTLDGGGALVSGETALDRPPHNAVDEAKFASYVYGLFDDAGELAACVDEARRRCAAGDPAEALVLGRDLHWASGGDPVREAYAHELLASAYRALDRPSLAGIAAAHHRHRDLPQVDVLVVKAAAS